MLIREIQKLVLATALAISAHATAQVVADETSEMAEPARGNEVESSAVKASLPLDIGAAILSEAQPQYHGSQELYLNTIREIENQYGAYDPLLIEQLIGLGIAQKSQGNHSQATEVFKRALHIKRIGDGLYSMQQIPILEYLIKSQIALDDWQSAANNLDYLYELQRYNYEDNNPDNLEVLIRLVQLYLLNYKQSDYLEALIQLSNANSVNRQIIKIIEKNYGPTDKRLADFLLIEAETDYSFLYAWSKVTANLDSNKRHILAKIKIPTANPYRDGFDALERRFDLLWSDSSIPLQVKLDALVQIGDWLFLFERKEAALRIYSKVQSLVESNMELEPFIADLFNKPHAFDFGLPHITGPVAPSAEHSYIDISFNVTEEGRMQNIQIVESDISNITTSDLAAEVKDLRYRPRIVNGVPVNTEGVTYRHSL